MIKARDRSGAIAVTFTLPSAVGALHASVCGEWNGWSPNADIMDLVESGFVLTILLDGGRSYRFRYLLDGARWENDWAADRYVPNAFGSNDSVLDLTALPWSPGDAQSQGQAPPVVRQATPSTSAPVAPDAPVAPSVPRARPTPAVTQTPPEPRTPEPSTAEPGVESAEPDGATPVGTNLEREAKLVAPAGLGMPNLDELVPGTRAVAQPVQRLDATYYDTPDLRLARSGITVRHRGGESGPAWTVKLPEDASTSDLVRREIRFDGQSGRVPSPAADLVLASTRMGTLQAVALLTTVRRPTEIRDGAGQLLAEVVDDTVSVSHDQGPVGRFREVEVELHTNGAKGRRVLDAAVTRLVEAGCDATAPMPKLVRALGEPATRPPDVVVPPLPEDADVIDLVRHSIARSVALIIRHDPGARLGDDEEEVHKLRVATRRLRSDLHSFGPLLDRARIKPIRAELGWLGGTVGAVRDTDVLRIRLATRLDTLSENDAPGADRLMRLLGQESATERDAMLAAMRDARAICAFSTRSSISPQRHPSSALPRTAAASHASWPSKSQRSRGTGWSRPLPDSARIQAMRNFMRYAFWPRGPGMPPRRPHPFWDRRLCGSPLPWRTCRQFWATIRTRCWPRSGSAALRSSRRRSQTSRNRSSWWNGRCDERFGRNGPRCGTVL